MNVAPMNTGTRLGHPPKQEIRSNTQVPCSVARDLKEEGREESNDHHTHAEDPARGVSSLWEGDFGLSTTVPPNFLASYCTLCDVSLILEPRHTGTTDGRTRTNGAQLRTPRASFSSFS